jgi:hypothetical protein
MLRLTKLSACLLATTVFCVTPAYGQATRTWVSGVGDDVNPCSRTAPCKTFAGAISKTAAGGEINCLDPGGYGAVTITKSITIDCEDTQGSILASNVNGVNVNDSASGFPNTIRVILRGLSINGAGGGAQNASGNPGSGLVGVNMTSGAVLIVEHCIIQNFNAGNASGIRVSTSGSSQVLVRQCSIVDNSAAGTGGGIFITPAAGAGGTSRVTLTNVALFNNTNAGLRIDTTGNTNATGVTAALDNVQIAGSTSGIIANQPAGTAPINVMVNRATIANNTSFGILASGATVRVRVGSSTITNNGTAALAAGGAIVNSYSNNQINGNATSDGTVTPLPPS